MVDVVDLKWVFDRDRVGSGVQSWYKFRTGMTRKEVQGTAASCRLLIGEGDTLGFENLGWSILIETDSFTLQSAGFGKLLWCQASCIMKASVRGP